MIFGWMRQKEYVLHQDCQPHCDDPREEGRNGLRQILHDTNESVMLDRITRPRTEATAVWRNKRTWKIGKQCGKVC